MSLTTVSDSRLIEDTAVYSIDSNDEDDKDDVIVTLSVPGSKPPSRTPPCSDPIVIPSDSEDSDCEVTIVSELSSLPALNSSSTSGSSQFSKVLGVSIAGPSDDDCFLSMPVFDCGTKPPSGVDPGLSHSIDADDKDVSTLRPSVGCPDLINDPFFQGKDPFLSDSSIDFDADILCPAASTVINGKDSQSSTDTSFLLSSSSNRDLDSTAVGSKPVSVEAQLYKTASDDLLSISSIPAVPTCTSVDSKVSSTSLMSVVSQDPTHSTSTLDCSQPVQRSNVTSLSPISLPAFDGLCDSGVKSSKSAVSSKLRPTVSHASLRHRRHSKPSQSDSTTLPVSATTTNGDEKWSVQSKGEFRVLLRRSQSQTTGGSLPDSGHQSPRKRRRHQPSCVDGSKLLSAPSGSSVMSDTTAYGVSLMSACYGCGSSIPTSELSYCMAGHGCCGQCLQSQVKTLLASGKKVTGSHFVSAFVCIGRVIKSTLCFAVFSLSQFMVQVHVNNPSFIYSSCVAD